MAAFARDIMNYRYYEAAEGGKREILEKILTDEKRKAPSRLEKLVIYPRIMLISFSLQ